jgi:DNA-binding response OmpR family regulator
MSAVAGLPSPYIFLRACRTFFFTGYQVSAIKTARGIVAIVDDDPQISRALGLWLEQQGLRTTHHLTGESLLHILWNGSEGGLLPLHMDASGPAEFRLVGAVLDLNLPGITGIELACTLRQLSPELPLAIVTALHDDERVRYGRPPSGIRCLKKPFDLDALEDALFPLLH